MNLNISYSPSFYFPNQNKLELARCCIGNISIIEDHINNLFENILQEMQQKETLSLPHQRIKMAHRTIVLSKRASITQEFLFDFCQRRLSNCSAVEIKSALQEYQQSGCLPEHLRFCKSDMLSSLMQQIQTMRPSVEATLRTFMQRKTPTSWLTERL